MSLINTPVQPFKAQAFKNGQFIEVTEQSLKGKWAVFVFYPADFTFVCPTELEDVANRYEELRDLGVEVYGISTDSHFAHKAWHDTSDAIRSVRYALVGDRTGAISRAFGVLDEASGMAQRGTFVINPDGIVKTAEIHDDGIGRDAAELVRKVKAAQYVAQNPGQVCPARWQEGAATLRPSLDLVGKI